MLDFVPFAGPRGEMTNMNGHNQFVCKLLQFELLQPPIDEEPSRLGGNGDAHTSLWFFQRCQTCVVHITTETKWQHLCSIYFC
jgi:hypothetical protein